MPHPSPTDLEKAELRKEAKHRRAAISPDERARAGEALVENFIQSGIIQLRHDASKNRPVISAYWPLKTEMDVRPLMNFLFRAGFTVALPVTRAARTPLMFREWTPVTKLVEPEEDFSTWEPPDDAATLTPDIIIVPLLGFDKNGTRLGFGQAHFDSTLKESQAVRVGAGFDVQEFESLPFDEYDQKLDYVITEKRILKFDRSPFKDS